MGRGLGTGLQDDCRSSSTPRLSAGGEYRLIRFLPLAQDSAWAESREQPTLADWL